MRAVDIHPSFAMCAAHDQRARADRRKHRVRVALGEERVARTGIFKYGNRVRVAVGVRDADGQGQQGRESQSVQMFHSISPCSWNQDRMPTILACSFYRSPEL